MKESISKKQGCKLHSGQKVVGRWQGNRYQIIKELGWGATGTVYLTRMNNNLAALKVGRDAMSITSEVNVLRHFSKVQGNHLGPSLFDVDDLVTSAGTFPFYVMEYLEGEEVIPFLKNRGQEWIGILVVQLLSDLDRLHQEGWVFGDLKPENLLVTGPPVRIRWFDVGGTTRMGRAVKEYTEFFDRGYWGLGGRKAEAPYDLFSVSMLMINSAYPSRFDRNEKENLSYLMSRVSAKPALKHYEQIIKNGLLGRYNEAWEMRKALVDLIGQTSFRKPAKSQQLVREKKAGPLKGEIPSKQPQNRKAYKRKKRVEKKRSSGLVETFLVASFLLLAYVLYLFVQMM
ncbi:protein kinase domain-containing protein [Alteribacter populi]|uniref:protein kinase domain-containing protein n=1 Tax=Alteribacter populi TaxID=2011011 RepID=UPI000BBB24FD|nr:serine/threonine protein kinase [Alteribacter populi]